MIDVERANIEALIYNRVERDPLAKEGLETLLGTANKGISRRGLLRHHREGAVKGKELELREGIDRLLSLYSLLEIGAYVGSVPTPLPPEVVGPALDVLTPEVTRRYYEEHYPLKLVSRFAARLRGKNADAVSDRHAEQARAVYHSLLDVDRSIVDDEDVQTFLWMLDDMQWGDIGLSTLLECSRDPKRYGDVLAGHEVQDYLAKAARGFLDFLEFAEKLDTLLRRAAEFENLAEQCWLHYEYWLRLLGAWRDWVNAMIDSLGQWRLGDDAADRSPPDVAPLKAVMARLWTGPEAYRRQD